VEGALGVSLLEATGVAKRFEGIAALIDVSLMVDRGERVGLIGPNGAGKTTFFNCLLGVTDADEGVVRFDGRDLHGLAVHERARLGIGRTFQRIELFGGMTVRQHLLVADRVRADSGGFWSDLIGRGGPWRDEISRSDEVLALLELDDLADEPVEALSLGQGRLVEVGRTLMTGPRLLLLDEPSSGLDRAETEALAATLRTVQDERDVAILLVEHDVELVASFTQRVTVLDFGQVIASGSTAEVMVDPVVRRAYLGDIGAAT
jgi:branched-chain amino acid transport system ATP-binding protein